MRGIAYLESARFRRIIQSEGHKGSPLNDLTAALEPPRQNSAASHQQGRREPEACLSFEPPRTGQSKCYALCVHSSFRCQPFVQLRPPASARDVADGDRDGLLLTDQNDQLLAPANAGIEQIPLQHGIMLGRYRDDHSGVFRALTLMDGRGIGRHQRIELAEPVGD